MEPISYDELMSNAGMSGLCVVPGASFPGQPLSPRPRAWRAVANQPRRLVGRRRHRLRMSRIPLVPAGRSGGHLESAPGRAGGV